MLTPETLPTQIGPYQIHRELGRGNMGIVYRAEDPRGNPVAIKTLLPELVGQADCLKRFEREARAMSRVVSLHTVRILEVGKEGGVPFFAMEYLRGQSLESYLKSGKSLNLSQVLRLAHEIGLGLESAHAQGVIHRDLKPDNIFLVAPHGTAKIVDFGIAREIDSSMILTQPGDIVGTPLYMSPEQLGTAVDERTDLFSFGVMLYRLLTGTLPFRGQTIWELADQIVSVEPPPVRELNPEVPEPLSDLVCGLMSKRSEQRPSLITTVLPLLRGLKLDLTSPVSPRPGTGLPAAVPSKGFAPVESPLTMPRNLELTIPGGLDCTGVRGAAAASVRDVQSSWATYHGVGVEESVNLGRRVRLEFVLVPPGSFWMGSPQSERSRGADEGPLHLVSINRPFFLSKFPITQREYELVTGLPNPSHFRAQPFAGQLPVERVSWQEAVAFCEKLALNVLPAGFVKVSLPTEGQWEYACRAGTRTAFHFGEEANGTEANCDGTHPYGTTVSGPFAMSPSPVGRYSPNAFGLFDMHGNVREWCLDGWDEGAYAKHGRNDPFIGWIGESRCVRGGSWAGKPDACRAAARSESRADDRRNQIGFRVVLIPE